MVELTLNTYVWDASALVKYFIREEAGAGNVRQMIDIRKGQNILLRNVLVETISIIKRKWREQNRSYDEEYFTHIFRIGKWIERKKMRMVEVDLSSTAIFLSIMDISKEFCIDFIDASIIWASLNITEIKSFAPAIISSDKGLIKASKKRNIKHIDPLKDEFGK